MSYGAAPTPLQFSAFWLPKHFPPPSKAASESSRTLAGSPASRESFTTQQQHHVAPFFAEFLGTFLLVFTCGFVAQRGEPAFKAGSVGVAVMALTYALGPVSGGHFNPAVSLASMLAGKLRIPQCLGYILFQLLGALLASLASTALLMKIPEFGPKPPWSDVEVGALELIYTGLVCFVYLLLTPDAKSVGRAKDGSQCLGLAVGLCVAAGGYAAGGASGGVLNPAIALGLDASPFFGKALGLHIIGYDPSFEWFLKYVYCELMGAVVAAVLFYVCRSRDEPPAVLSRLLAEFLGSFLVALSAGLCVLERSPVMPLAYAAAVGSLTYALEQSSGAHFNAAITLAAAMTGRRRLRCEGLGYVAAQLLGGLAAGRLLKLFLQHWPLATFALAPVGKTPWQTALVCELAFSAMLVFVFLSVQTKQRPTSASSRQSYTFGLAVACSVTAGSFSIRTVSGGVLNPTVAAALAVAFGDPTGLAFASYALFQVAGGLLAVVAFTIARPEEFPKNWKLTNM